MKDIDQYRAKLKKLNDEAAALRKEGCKIFEAAAQDLFAAYPALESFAWRQYTPYFNDGDVCTFGVYADEPTINGVSIDEVPYNGNRYQFDKVSQWAGIPDPEQLMEEIYRLVDALDYDCLEEYGEGEVTVTRTGISVEYIDHD